MSEAREIEEAAAEWLARRYAGLTEQEEQELAAWLGADPLHAAALAELEAAWRLLDRVREEPLANARVDPDALARPARRRAWRWVTPSLATAAALGLGYFGWWQPAQRAALRYTEAAITAVGSFQKLTLPDGSVVRLNTDSRVEIHYTENERRVRLARGEAHFSVAKNAARPFFVEAGSVAVRAVGTAFNVRLNAEALEVLVTEGRVRVDDAARGETVLAPRVVAEVASLGAGERVVIPAATVAVPMVQAKEAVAVSVPVASVSAAEIERALAWQDRRLEFVAVPLGEIVAEFNRYNRARLVIEDGALAQRRFGGSFRADEPETFVRLLQTRFGLKAEQRGDETVLRP